MHTFRAFLLLVLVLVLVGAAPARAQSSEPVLSLSPRAGSPGATLTATGADLVDGRTYRLRLRDRGVDLLLGSQAASNGRVVFRLAVPAVAPDAYTVQLEHTALGTVVDASATFRVVAGMTLAPATTNPQAGKPLDVALSQLARGSLRLRYAGRVVFGPRSISGTTAQARFVIPTDIPGSLPASVPLVAEVVQGRNLVQSGSVTLNVRAPHQGPRLGIRDLVAPSQVRPRDPVRLQGQLDTFDGVPRSNVQLSAFWVSNGVAVPLPTNGYTVNSDGRFTFDTRAPGFGAMTAAPVSGPGQMRLVARTDEDDGSAGGATRPPEHAVTDGPNTTTILDLDPQVDLTFIVRRNVSQGPDQLLEGAFVVLSPFAPLQESQPDDPPAVDESPVLTSTSAMLTYHGHQWQATNSTLVPNQVGAGWQVHTPQPACGNSLYRKFTAADGRASFEFEAEVDSGFSSVGETQFALLNAQDCIVEVDENGNPTRHCQSVDDRSYEFEATVYTAHTGAGAIGPDGVEIPARYRITYFKSRGEFRILDLRTGATSTQTGSANIQVRVNQITSGGPAVSLGGLAMWQHPATGGSPRSVPLHPQKGFGPFVDFSGISNVVFTHQNLRRFVSFVHHPGPVGSLQSARLEFDDGGTIAHFQRVTPASGGCEASLNGEEQWVAEVGPLLENFMRMPRPILLQSPNDLAYCPNIIVRDALGQTAGRSLCLHWQRPPSYFSGFDTLEVDDADMTAVRVSAGQPENDRTTRSPPPGEFMGEPVGETGERVNRGRQARRLTDIIGIGGSIGAERTFDSNLDKQFNRGPHAESQSVDFNEGASTIQIGSDDWHTIIDVTIPIFRWVWGLPEVIGAELYADLRLLAQYYLNGTLTRTGGGGESLDLTANALFAIFLIAGFDVDVLFGLFFDAGATLLAIPISEIPTVVENNELDASRSGPCFRFKIDFYGWFDPCPLCPTPVIEEEGNILDARDPAGCGFSDLAARGGVVPTGGDIPLPTFGRADARALFRHPVAAFDGDGNGVVLMLDDARRLIAREIEGDELGPDMPLSNAPGIRHPRVVYTSSDRALAIWIESALSASAFAGANRDTQERNQRVAWSRFDGRVWSAKAFLTAPGNGVAQLSLAACTHFAAGCLRSGTAYAVWQVNESDTASAPRFRLHGRRWTASGGWEAAAEIDRGVSNVQDITPTVAFVGGNPAVAWVRYAGTDLSAVEQRVLAYRIVGAGNASVVPGSPRRVAAPSLLGSAGSTLRIAYTSAEAGTGFIGTRHALQLGEATCSSGTCTFNLRPARDAANRPIYGEKPLLLAGAWGDPHIVMRAFHFGNLDPSEPFRPGDPIGTALISGDLLAIAPRFTDGSVRFRALTADGAMHFGHAAAFNAANDELLALSVPFAPPEAAPLRAAIAKLGLESVRTASRSLGMQGAVELRAMPLGPDFAVAEPTATATAVNGGSNVLVRVVISNRGSSYEVERDGAATLSFHWDRLAGAPALDVALTNLAAGSDRTVTALVPVPAGFRDDEIHVLHARVVAEPSVMEAGGDDNHATREFGRMPVPQALRTEIRRGVPFVQLSWTAVEDSRVAGYRIWAEDRAGKIFALGSSTTNGFLDLSAQFDAPRRYFVTTYSGRGVESARSEGVRATSTRTVGDDPLFRDGFEAAP